MNRINRALIGSTLFTLVMCMPALHASVWDKKTVLTVNEEVEVPGAILQPGKYVMKVVDLASTRDVVTFMNERENQVITTVMAIPAYRMRPAERTVLTFYETPIGQPEALKEWYYPGDQYGREFVYSRQRAAELGRRASYNERTDYLTSNAGPISPAQVQAVEPDPNIEESTASSPAPATAPQSEPTLIAQATPPKESPLNEPVLLAQNTPPPTPDPDPATQKEMPKTASQTLAILLLGLGGLGGGLTLHKLRRQLT